MNSLKNWNLICMISRVSKKKIDATSTSGPIKYRDIAVVVKGYIYFIYKMVMRPSYLYNGNPVLMKQYLYIKSVPGHSLKNRDQQNLVFLAATKQLYKWYFPSARPSVCLSVRHTFFTMFPSLYHHEIFRSYYQWQKWRPCKRSRSEVKGQGHRGQHPT